MITYLKIEYYKLLMFSKKLKINEVVKLKLIEF